MAVFFAASVTTTFWLHPPDEPLSWSSALWITLQEVLHWRIWIWWILGLGLAYRLPSRRWR
jgi:hypothetical protein